MTQSGERLNKYLALHASISRRAADELIEAGRVAVNGQTVQLGARVPEKATVSIDGRLVVPKVEHTYLAFHKPSGYVCSRKMQGESNTIYSLIPKQYHHLNPVGRLDKDSSGILLLTNDGNFAHQMTHPKFRKTKVYEVQLDKPLEPLHQQMISDYGVSLDDGPSKFELERLDDSRASWRVTMSEGRNRQIRRTFAALGYTVQQLHRTQFGPYGLSGLRPKELQVIHPTVKL